MTGDGGEDEHDPNATGEYRHEDGALSLGVIPPDYSRQEGTRISTIATLRGDRPSEDAERARNNDCIVVIYTKEPMLLGKRFVLDFSPVRVGRSADNHIVLEGESVSRRHAHLEQRGSVWWAVDDGSTNGTYVNDEQIGREFGLANGDRFKIGPTIFKYLSGGDVEAQYHAEIYRMTIIDGLTQAHVKRYLLEALEKEIIRARRKASELSFIMFDIDHFKKINDHHGHLAGDFVLRELARIVLGRIRRDEVFARYGGEEFAIVLPETGLDGARAFADGLREKIESSRFVFQGHTIAVTISAGVALLATSDKTSLDVIRATDERLYEAKRTGRNRVVSVTGEPVRRHVEPTMAIARCPGGTVIALELADEPRLRAARGSAGYSALFAELSRSIDTLASPEDVLASWQERVLFIVRPVNLAATADALAALVESSFRARAEDAPPLNRVVVPLTGRDNVAPNAQATVDHVVAQLLALRLSSPAVPLALVGKVGSRRTSESRCTGLRHALEVGLAYLVALEVAVLRNAGELESLAKVLRSQPGYLSPNLSLGTWRQLADALAGLVPDGTAVGEAARGLRDARAKMTTQGRAIEAAVRVRNQVTHGASRDPDAYEDEERELREGVDALLAVLAPVARLPLVAFTEGVEQLDDDSTVYPFSHLHGLSGTYARRTETLPWRLRKHWCYVLLGAEKPLLLAPIFFAKVCGECGELEVAWARHLSFGERGAPLRGSGLLTDHPLEVTLPADGASEKLAEELRK